MALTIAPPPDQLKDLALLRDTDPKLIDKIVTKLSASDYLITPSELRYELRQILDGSDEQTNALARLLLSLYTLLRQRDLEVSDLLEGLSNGIDTGKINWKDEEVKRWNSLLPKTEKLLSLESVQTVVKALDLSYDYANLYQNAKILTDIRPIFNKNADNIEGAVVSFTLRLYYDSLEGPKSISIALDIEDIENMITNSQRAKTKAETAQDFMLNNNISKTFICGNSETAKDNNHLK